MHYCLNREELTQLIDFEYSGKEVQLDYLRLRIVNSQNWQDELGCMNYLFAQILGRKVKQKFKNCSYLIQFLNDLVDQMYVRIHDCDHSFVNYMTRYVRETDLSLEEELVKLHNYMCEYIYE